VNYDRGLENAMTVQTISWGWDAVFGGSDGYTATHQWNFAPINAMAQTSLSVGSPGLGIIGFTQYVTRPDPNGADQVHNLSSFNAPNGGIALSGVTWILLCGGGDDQMAGSALIFSFV
jgi:hypothetical protein